jgi:hypothetical protein
MLSASREISMGDYFQSIVDRDATVAEAESLGADIREWLIEQRIIAAQMKECVTGAPVGYPPGANADSATAEFDEAWCRYWTDGLRIVTRRSVFWCGEGGFDLACNTCGKRTPDVRRGAPEDISDAFNRTVLVSGKL